MSENKLVKIIMDPATLTGLAAGIGWIGKKVVKENFTNDLSSNIMNYAKFTAVTAGSIALKQYLEQQKILPVLKKCSFHKMASIALMMGGAILNAAVFTGGNYLTRYIAGDSGQAALAEKARHDKALEAYQASMEKYNRERCSFLTGLRPTEKSKNRQNKTSRTPITRSSSTTGPNLTTN